MRGHARGKAGMVCSRGQGPPGWRRTGWPTRTAIAGGGMAPQRRFLVTAGRDCRAAAGAHVCARLPGAQARTPAVRDDTGSSTASSGAADTCVCRERGRSVSTPRDAAPDTTRGWAAPWHVHWRSWASACPMASSNCSSRSSSTTVRLLDCPSASYWSAILYRSRSSITGCMAIWLSFG